MNPTLALVIGLALGIFAQISLKAGVRSLEKQQISRRPLLRFFLHIFRTPYVLFGFLFYGISILLWLYVLSAFELSYVYPLVSINYVFVVIGSKLFFQESVGKRWPAIFLIIVGVVLVGIS